MSGGSMDYLYLKVEDASMRIDSPLRRAFWIHLKKVAKALHDIEWVDSGDYARGDEVKAIEECLAPGALLTQVLAEAKAAVSTLAAEITLAEEKRRSLTQPAESK